MASEAPSALTEYMDETAGRETAGRDRRASAPALGRRRSSLGDIFSPQNAWRGMSARLHSRRTESRWARHARVTADDDEAPRREPPRARACCARLRAWLPGGGGGGDDDGGDGGDGGDGARVELIGMDSVSDTPLLAAAIGFIVSYFALGVFAFHGWCDGRHLDAETRAAASEGGPVMQETVSGGLPP